jgi:hypothetical protein
MVRICLRAADHTKRATLNGTLVLQTLFQETDTIMTTQDTLEGFNTKLPIFGRGALQPIFPLSFHSC